MAVNVSSPSGSQETASLVTRLAGPSTGKAGLSIDQTEINRVIAEASKGSKFYENEKKKDKDLTKRIQRILEQRDDALRASDTPKIELSVDHLLSELEAHRDLTQTIVHVDMDAFYANVELLHDPSLNGKPFGVGSGVLTTASYEARKYGVRSGMPGFIAKKLCPDIILVPITFSRYMDMSNIVMAIFRRYDPNMSPAGCDEGYLNITRYCQAHNLSAEECVSAMRTAVYEETKLTVSAGIAPNKMLAKICSDKNKPNGQYQLPFDGKSITSFMHNLSIRKIPGIGRVNERLLEAIGIKTCGDIFIHRATISLMDKQFGLRFLLQTYLGIGSNVVQPHQRGERKSIGAERTFSPLGDIKKILQKLSDVALELEKDMEQNGWVGRTVTLKYKLDTYQVFTRAKSFDRWISTKDELYATGKELLLPESPLTLRLIGLRVTKLKDLKAAPAPISGIKRFFEPLQNESPSKKTKIEHHEYTGHTDNDSRNLDDTMPGFHEQDEMDDSLSQPDCDSIPEVEQDDFPEGPQAPVSASSCSSSNVLEVNPVPVPATSYVGDTGTCKTRNPRKPGPLKSVQTPDKTTFSIHNCPICGRTLETDNQGFNSHIDFCLSRSAIREAQVEASSPVKARPIIKSEAARPAKRLKKRL